jgi:hypothetical protein
MAQKCNSLLGFMGYKNCSILENGIEKNYGINGTIYWTQDLVTGTKTFYDVNNKTQIPITDPRIRTEFPMLDTELQMLMQNSRGASGFDNSVGAFDFSNRVGDSVYIPPAVGSRANQIEYARRGGKKYRSRKMRGGSGETGVMPHCAKVWSQQGQYPYALEPNMMGGKRRKMMGGKWKMMGGSTVVPMNPHGLAAHAGSVKMGGARRARSQGRSQMQQRSQKRSQRGGRSQRRSRQQRRTQRRQRR